MKLVFKYIGMHLKSQLEYRSSFIMSLLAQLLPMAFSASMVFVLLNKFNFLERFNMYEVMLIISIVQFGHSFSECFGRGFDKFSDIIKYGKLDLILIKPRSIYMQVFGNKIEFTKFSRVIGSLILFVIGIHNLNFDKSVLNILLLIGLLIFSAIIYVAMYIFAACFCFKTIEGLEFTNIFTDSSHEFGQYPMEIFRKEVLFVFTYFIPIACVNYYPIRFILGKSNSILYLISPLFSILFLTISILVFNKCLKNYTSAGS